MCRTVHYIQSEIVGLWTVSANQASKIRHKDIHAFLRNSGFYLAMFSNTFDQRKCFVFLIISNPGGPAACCSAVRLL